MFAGNQSGAEITKSWLRSPFIEFLPLGSPKIAKTHCHDQFGLAEVVSKFDRHESASI